MYNNAPHIRLAASRFHKRFYRRMSTVACYRALMTLPPAVLDHAVTVLSVFADGLFVNSRTRFRFTLDAFLAEAREEGLALEPLHLLGMQFQYKHRHDMSPVYQVDIMLRSRSMPRMVHVARGYIYHWLFLSLRFAENHTVESFHLAVKEDRHLLDYLRWMSHVHRLARACVTPDRCDRIFAEVPLNLDDLLSYWMQRKTEAPEYETDQESDNGYVESDAMDVDM